MLFLDLGIREFPLDGNVGFCDTSFCPDDSELVIGVIDFDEGFTGAEFRALSEGFRDTYYSA